MDKLLATEEKQEFLTLSILSSYHLQNIRMKAETMLQTIQLNPIGKVVTTESSYELHLASSFRSGLIGLENFSHINVLWWGHMSHWQGKKSELLLNRPYKKGPKNVGLFATRAEQRPNPLLLSTTAVLDIDIDQGRIKLPWFDAGDQSPILDIKPYLPCADKVEIATIPQWMSHWPSTLEGSAYFDWASEFNF